MFDDLEALSAGVSPVEERWCAVLARAEPPVPPRRVWIIDEGATHGEGPQTGLGRLLDLGVAQLERAHDIERQMARAAADRARALAAFARMRPAAAFDRAPGEVGAASAASRAARAPTLEAVSEWAADEVAAALALSPPEAVVLLTDCLVLVEQLPATLTALEQGRIGWEHARVLAQMLAPVSDEKRSAVEARVLARAHGKSRTQLRVAARRAILREDADAAIERAARAIRQREVRLYPGNDGMGSLSVTLPIPVARACLRALEQSAEACAVEGDERTKAQRMADCLTDLILRPGNNGLPPVQVELTVVAAVKTLLGGDEPGEVDGDVVPAALVRELAYTLGLLRRPDTAAEQDASRPPTDEAAAREGLAELLGVRRISGTALAGRPHIAIVDELSGALLALTDAAGLRSGTGLGPPPESPRYRPSTELDRFVRLRDRRCRFPGCRARPRKCDLDHTCPWPWGPTSHDNLCCLCEHHHRLSHQAPGWQLRAEDGGGLTWRLPGGDTLTTYPPAFGTDTHLPPADAREPVESPPPEPTPRPAWTLELLRRWTPTPDTQAAEHEPPPF